MFKIVKRYFDRGNYTKEDVAKFVKAGKITEEEYAEITGYDYQTGEPVPEEENV